MGRFNLGWRVGLVLSVLTLGAAILRFAGLDHGLPWVVGPDEGFEVHRALRLGAGEFDLERTGKGGLFYLLFVEYALYFVWLFVSGVVKSAGDFALRFAVDPTPFWLLGRATSAALGTLIVPVTFYLGRRLYGVGAGLFGAAVVAVSWIHVVSAHFVNVDLPMTLLVVVTAVLAAEWAGIGERGRPEGRPWAFGAALGGAVLCKLPAALLALMALVANRIRGDDGPWWRRWVGGRLWMVAGVAALVLLIGNPGLVLAFRSNLDETLQSVVGVGLDGAMSSGPGENLWLFYLRALSESIGTPMLVLSLAGVVWAMVRRRRGDILALAFVIPSYLLFAGARSGELYYVRYVIPWIPFLGLLAGRLVVDMLNRSPLSGRVASAVLALIAVVTLWPVASASTGYAAERMRLDSREVAVEWVEENLPPLSSVFVTGNATVRSALSVPLRNSGSNLESIAETMGPDEAARAEIVRARSALEAGVPYDLHAVRHFEPNRSLDEYLADGVTHFVIERQVFDPATAHHDKKHAAEVVDSRVALYEALNADETVERVFEIDPKVASLSGPALEVYSAAGGASKGSTDRDLGELAPTTLWTALAIDIDGPKHDARRGRNPFEVEWSAVFTAPSGRHLVVPGHFAGDGTGGQRGSVWRVLFTPDEVGEWTFVTKSGEPWLDGFSGRFAAASGKGRGRLSTSDRPYLRFADGTYWLKGGADDPEDFLAPQVMGNWARKRSAIDHLADRGVTSMYLMLHTVEGDGDNVWPWIRRKESDRFDLEKLREWGRIFDYLESHGMVLHLVLEDDSGWTGFDRRLYYREMVSRFAHHNALIWNVSEEYNENYSPEQIRAFGRMLADLDAYDHPITVHHADSPDAWKHFVQDPVFGITSFQTDKSPQNRTAVEWRRRAAQSGRSLAISFDEIGAATLDDRDLVRHIVWSVYLGGASFEMHVESMTDFRKWDPMWDDIRRAREFMESLPFWEMEPCNERVRSGTAYCYGREDGVTALYLPRGGELAIDLPGEGDVTARWYNPRNGAWSNTAVERTDDGIRLDAPPFAGDAAVTLR